MTEIRVEVSEEKGRFKLLAEGHAGYSNEGEDIVCAAISTLCCTLAEALTRLMQEGKAILTRCVLATAHVDIDGSCVEGSTDARIVFLAILSGLELLEKEYPKHVQLIVIPSEKSGGTKQK